jgi:hypothetical protein
MLRKISVNTQTGGSRPEAFITKGKLRLKQNIDTVYLNNGDEFEVELYNPTQNKVLAKIEMNGDSIGAGVILRPGQRIFLERFLNEAKKFLFETYTVEGDNKSVENAIAKNGDVIVKFYDEYIQQPYYVTNTAGYNTLTVNNANFGTTYEPSVTYTTNNVYGTITTSNSTLNATTGSYTTTLANTSNVTTDPGINYDRSFTNKLKKETGRVEKGSESDQIFTYENTFFNYFPCASSWWKIKPMSEKIMEKEDLKVFCTECGSKRKKDSHKFCPHCGTKF